MGWPCCFGPVANQHIKAWVQGVKEWGGREKKEEEEKKELHHLPMAPLSGTSIHHMDFERHWRSERWQQMVPQSPSEPEWVVGCKGHLLRQPVMQDPQFWFRRARQMSPVKSRLSLTLRASPASADEHRPGQRASRKTWGVKLGRRVFEGSYVPFQSLLPVWGLKLVPLYRKKMHTLKLIPINSK